MPPKKAYQSQKSKGALDVALGMLGNSSRTILLHYIMKRYGVTYERAKECSVIEIELVLRNILGPGAAIIIERMHNELARTRGK